MGRRADPPRLQAAKGHPGKREKTVKRRLQEAQRVAKLLADVPAESADKLSPPKFMDGRFPGALAVWRQLAPKLRETHRLPNQHRLTFAMLCVYFAEWVSANEDIAKNGYSQFVPTVAAGGEMERIRPVVRMREIAFANVMELSGLFGLTPADEYALFKDQRLAATNNPGLFDDDHGQPHADAAPADGVVPERKSQVGGMAALDSAPPAGVRPN